MITNTLHSLWTISKVYPPGPPLEKSLTKLSKVVEDCSPALILMDSRVSRLRNLDRGNPLSKTRGLWPRHIDIRVTDSLAPYASSPPYEFANTRSTAFLQYTSGSTGDPKGVMISFSALAENIDLITYCNAFALYPSEDVVGFSWLPQYHDRK